MAVDVKYIVIDPLTNTLANKRVLSSMSNTGDFWKVFNENSIKVAEVMKRLVKKQHEAQRN